MLQDVADVIGPTDVIATKKNCKSWGNIYIENIINVVHSLTIFNSHISWFVTLNIKLTPTRKAKLESKHTHSKIN